MKKIAALFAVAAAVLMMATAPDPRVEQRGKDVTTTLLQQHGSPHFLGIITVIDGGSLNNWNTVYRNGDAGLLVDGGPAPAWPFDGGHGIVLLAKCDGGAYAVGGTGAATAATTDDYQYAAGVEINVTLLETENAWAVKPVSGPFLGCALFKTR